MYKARLKTLVPFIFPLIVVGCTAGSPNYDYRFSGGPVSAPDYETAYSLGRQHLESDMLGLASEEFQLALNFRPESCLLYTSDAADE